MTNIPKPVHLDHQGSARARKLKWVISSCKLLLQPSMCAAYVYVQWKQHSKQDCWLALVGPCSAAWAWCVFLLPFMQGAFAALLFQKKKEAILLSFKWMPLLEAKIAVQVFLQVSKFNQQQQLRLLALPKKGC